MSSMDHTEPETIEQTDDAAEEQESRWRVPAKRRPWNQWRFNPEPEVAENVENEIFFEGDRRAPYLFRFFALLVFSVFIASFGLIANSSAVVIAAMIVAPLMMPIMGIAVGIVSGRPHRQLESGLLVLVATGAIFLQAFIIALLAPEPAVIPDEIMSRTDPKMIDLLIALAAGAAGGYSIVRREASSALAGVAIGVSLVPPLSSCGILVGWGEADLASGALLLYVTNLAAIVITGAVIFAFVGFMPISQFGHMPHRIKIGLFTAVVAVILVAIPLYNHSETVLEESETESAVSKIITQNLEGTPFELFEYTEEGDTIIVSILGPASTLIDPPAPPQKMADELSEELGTPVDLEIRLFPFAAFDVASDAGVQADSGQ